MPQTSSIPEQQSLAVTIQVGDEPSIRVHLLEAGQAQALLVDECIIHVPCCLGYLVQVEGVEARGLQILHELGARHVASADKPGKNLLNLLALLNRQSAVAHSRH
jgi:hypothetical protein